MVSGISIGNKESEDLFLDVLPVKRRQALLSFSKLSLLGPHWYLAGGTALALQIGRRVVGVQPYEVFAQVIEEELARQE